MSFNISFVLLLLLLLCISLHACNARRLAVLKNQPDDKLHISNPNGVAVGAASSMSHKTSRRITKKEDDKVLKSKQKKAVMGEKNGKEESLVKVAWRVPHNKHEEKHPGFNLDYSPPKTHPPSHN